MGECLTDFDCPGSQICFNVEDTDTNATNFCDCNAILGWKGENCDEFIPGYAFFMATNLVLFVAGVGMLLRAVLFDLPIIWRTKLLHWNVVTFHWVLILLTLINYQVVIFTYSYDFFTPLQFTNGTTISVDGEFLKLDGRAASATYSAVLYIFFLFLLYTSISLSWIENAKKIELFSAVLNDNAWLKKLKYIIAGNILVVVLVLFIVTAKGYIALYLYIIVIDGTLFIMAIYCYGYTKFSNLLAEISAATSKLSQENDDQTSQENKSLQKQRLSAAVKAYNLIKLTALSTIISFGIYALGAAMIISFEYTPEKKEPRPNHINLSIIGFETQVLAAFFGTAMVYNYVTKTIKGSATYFKKQMDLEFSGSTTVVA